MRRGAWTPSRPRSHAPTRPPMSGPTGAAAAAEAVATPHATASAGRATRSTLPGRLRATRITERSGDADVCRVPVVAPVMVALVAPLVVVEVRVVVIRAPALLDGA